MIRPFTIPGATEYLLRLDGERVFSSLRTDLAFDALEQAISSRRQHDLAGLAHHSAQVPFLRDCLHLSARRGWDRSPSCVRGRITFLIIVMGSRRWGWPSAFPDDEIG